MITVPDLGYQIFNYQLEFVLVDFFIFNLHGSGGGGHFSLALAEGRRWMMWGDNDYKLILFPFPVLVLIRPGIGVRVRTVL